MRAAPPGRPATAVALWPLPLAAGLMPAVATLAAWGLSVHLGLVPSCNPFVDGCVSISRAARHDLPNHVFRTLVLPAAVLQALTWWLAARWLRGLPGAAAMRGLAALPPLGVTAAVALVLYGSFLGTEGPIYRALRQYGTVVYFGFTCLCLLIAGGAVQRAVAAGALALAPSLRHAMVGLSVALVLLGLGNALVGAAADGELKHRVENLTEWWGALIFVLGFVALAAMWRHCRLQLSLRDGGP
jgi:hypothetical protein